MNNQGSFVAFKCLQSRIKVKKTAQLDQQIFPDIKVKISFSFSSLNLPLAFHYCFVAHKEDTKGIMSEQAHSNPYPRTPRERLTQNKKQSNKHTSLYHPRPMASSNRSTGDTGLNMSSLCLAMKIHRDDLASYALLSCWLDESSPAPPVLTQSGHFNTG